MEKLAWGNTPSAAYEATHGYSDQYIVEYNIFIECAQVAGFEIDLEHNQLFPNSNKPMISINIFK